MTNDEWQQMHAKLVAAAGSRLDPTSPGLMISSKVESWLAHGYSFDLDVLPAVQKAAKKGSSIIFSWSYFDGAVRQYAAMRQRQKIAPSRHANSKGFNKEDKPRDPEHVRKRAVAEWRKIRDGNLADQTDR